MIYAKQLPYKHDVFLDQPRCIFDVVCAQRYNDGEVSVGNVRKVREVVLMGAHDEEQCGGDAGGAFARNIPHRF